MTDTVIKGSGNSRGIKAAATLPAAWDDARTLLISQGWPIDLLGLNPAGCEQIGDNLDKSTLLKDATEKAIWGSAGNRTVDAALSQLRALITTMQNNLDKKSRMEVGSYTGDGSETRSLYFSSQTAKLVLVSSSRYILVAIRPCPDVYMVPLNDYQIMQLSWGSYTMSFTASPNQMNVSGNPGYYVAFF